MKMKLLLIIALTQVLFASQAIKSVRVNDSELEGEWRIDEALLWELSPAYEAEVNDPMVQRTKPGYDKKGGDAVANYQYRFTPQEGGLEVYEIKNMRYKSAELLHGQWKLLSERFVEPQYSRCANLSEECFVRKTFAPKYVLRKGVFYISVMVMMGENCNMKMVLEKLANKIEL